LKKEKDRNRFVRMEMLAALAEIGPAALGEEKDGGELLDELLEIAKSTRDEEKPAQTCAALALAKIAPTSKQGKQALTFLARGLLRKGEDPNETQQWNGLFRPAPRRKIGGFVLETVPSKQPARTDPVIEEVHERAKETLVKAGVAGANALAGAFKTTFNPTRTDPPVLITEKIKARKLTFELIGLIGPEASKSRDVNSIFTLTSERAKKLLESDEVITAAREAKQTLSGK
jgi:hypothetical protein